MSKPRYWWWGSIQNALRAYPRFKERYEAPEIALTAKYVEPVGHSSDTGRTTETVALKSLNDGDYRAYIAIRAAMKETEQMPNGAERLKLIDLLYWKRYWRTIEGAAYEVGYSKDRAKEFHTEFIRLVGHYMGYIPHDKVAKRRNVTLNSQKPVVK